MKALKQAVIVLLFLAVWMQSQVRAQTDCVSCDAWALYVLPPNQTLYTVQILFSLPNYTELQKFNNITNVMEMNPGTLLYVPFTCDCHTSGTTFSHSFSYSVSEGDQIQTIASMKYSNLTTAEAIQSASPNANSLLPGTVLQIPVNCSCGDSSVSKHYGMFGTYTAQPGDTLSSLSKKFDIQQEFIRQYNPTVSFDTLQPFTSILFIPTINSSGQYPPLIASQGEAGNHGASIGLIIGVVVGAVAFVFVFGLVLWHVWPKWTAKSYGHAATGCFTEEALLELETVPNKSIEYNNKTKDEFLRTDHCVQLTFAELADATDNFNISRKIGKGGFATVFYGKWKGKVRLLPLSERVLD